jgi:aldose 1-epimerase
MKLVYLLSATAVMLTACSGSSSDTEKDSSQKDNNAQYTLADKKDFAQTIDEKQVSLYVLKNKGIEAAITNYGGRVVNLLVPDKNGNPIDVIVGPGTLQQFIDSKEPYFGATIGRYGNRIAKGKFSLNGNEYTLAINNVPNSLHGGKKGFQYVVWNAEQPSDSVLTLSYLSKDGEEGFPGNLNVKVSYTLTADTGMRIDYEATTDKPTVCNLTTHAYYNLNGYNAGTTLNHLLQLYASNYTPVDSTLIPVGKIEPVAGTPLDFTTPQTIGARINDTNNIQLKNGKGYDHNFVLNQNTGNELQKAATAKGDKSGIVLTIYTQEPGLQFYSGNFMHSQNAVKGNHNDEYRTAIALEPHHFPDSPNQPQFPGTELKPGETYKTTSVYKFSVEK